MSEPNTMLQWLRFDLMPTQDSIHTVIREAVNFFDEGAVATVRIYWGTCRETGKTLWAYEIGAYRSGGADMRTCDEVHCVSKLVTWEDLHGMHNMGGCASEYARHLFQVIQETR